MLSPRSVRTRVRTNASFEPLPLRQEMRTFSPSCVMMALTPITRSESCVDWDTDSSDAATTRSRLAPGPQVRHGLPTNRKFPVTTHPADRSVASPTAQAKPFAHDMGFLLWPEFVRTRERAGLIATAWPRGKSKFGG